MGTKPRPMADRFWEKVDKEGPIPALRPELGPCWEWTASQAINGYGVFVVSKGHVWRAHRVAYVLVRGSIPDGLEIDHLCRNRVCVNPAHLEAVTHRVNTLRGEAVSAKNAVKTECPNGHPYDEANTHLTVKGTRACRACGREKYRQRAGMVQLDGSQSCHHCGVTLGNYHPRFLVRFCSKPECNAERARYYRGGRKGLPQSENP